MDNYTREHSPFFANMLNMYKKNFITHKLNKIGLKIEENKNIQEKIFLKSYIKELKHPYVFFWGFITYNITNIIESLKYFNVVKEKNLHLGETLENIIKSRSIKDLSVKNLFKFFSTSFTSINGLIFRPGIIIPKTFIYFSGVMNFYINERANLKDYAYLLFSSFFLAIPFYFQLDKFLLEKLRLSRLEQNNINFKNLSQNRLLTSTVYAFIDNFVLNMLFFGCLDLIGKINNKREIQLTYDQKKLDEIRNIGEENETLGRVLLLNSTFIKRDFSDEKVYEYFFAGLLTATLFSPIETLFFILRKNLYNFNLFMKNISIVSEEGNSLNAILLKKSFKMNIFRIMITHTLNCLLLQRSVKTY